VRRWVESFPPSVQSNSEELFSPVLYSKRIPKAHVECQGLQRRAQGICSPCWKSMDQLPGSKFECDAPEAADA